MKTETSLVAEQVHLQQWAIMIRECQNRPEDMSVATWCHLHGITKSNYYYRLRRVRQAVLAEIPDSDPESSDNACFAELKIPEDPTAHSAPAVIPTAGPCGAAAVLHSRNGFSIELFPHISPEMLRLLMEGLLHAQ